MVASASVCCWTFPAVTTSSRICFTKNWWHTSQQWCFPFYLFSFTTTAWFMHFLTLSTWNDTKNACTIFILCRRGVFCDPLMCMGTHLEPNIHFSVDCRGPALARWLAVISLCEWVNEWIEEKQQRKRAGRCCSKQRTNQKSTFKIKATTLLLKEKPTLTTQNSNPAPSVTRDISICVRESVFKSRPCPVSMAFAKCLRTNSQRRITDLDNNKWMQGNSQVPLYTKVWRAGLSAATPFSILVLLGGGGMVNSNGIQGTTHPNWQRKDIAKRVNHMWRV